MGIGLFSASDDFTPSYTPPNPDPKRWQLLDIIRYNTTAAAAFAIKVKYLDCTNYEGVKVMVYEGKDFNAEEAYKNGLDPHFSKEHISPVARFEPTERGWKMAKDLAYMISAGNYK